MGVFDIIRDMKAITINTLFKAIEELKYLSRIIKKLKDSIKALTIAITYLTKISTYMVIVGYFKIHNSNSFLCIFSIVFIYMTAFTS